MNEHEVTQRNLAALIAGLLPSAEEIKAREHMAECAECHRQLEGLITLTKTVRRLRNPELTTAQLTRLNAMARARRQEVMEQRQHHWVLVALAIFGWVMFLSSLTLLGPLNHALQNQFGWSPLVTGLTSLTLWGTFCWAIAFGLIPLLHLHRFTRQEKPL